MIDVSNTPIRDRVLEVLGSCDKPATVDYVRYNAKICWSSAKTALLELSLEGKVEATRTTAGWLFQLKSKEGSV